MTFFHFFKSISDEPRPELIPANFALRPECRLTQPPPFVRPACQRRGASFAQCIISPPSFNLTNRKPNEMNSSSTSCSFCSPNAQARRRRGSGYIRIEKTLFDGASPVPHESTFGTVSEACGIDAERGFSLNSRPNGHPTYRVHPCNRLERPESCGGAPTTRVFSPSRFSHSFIIDSIVRLTSTCVCTGTDDVAEKQSTSRIEGLGALIICLRREMPCALFETVCSRKTVS